MKRFLTRAFDTSTTVTAKLLVVHSANNNQPPPPVSSSSFPWRAPLSSSSSSWRPTQVDKSNISPHTMQAFVDTPVVLALQCIPGIGPRNAALLGHMPPVRLQRLFDSCRRLPNPGGREHQVQQAQCDGFYQALRARGVNTHRNSIVHAMWVWTYIDNNAATAVTKSNLLK